jgi:hypothetical protein
MTSTEMNKHLTVDELVERLYGICAGGHLRIHTDECEECSKRFEALRERKEMAAQAAPASYDFLSAQRRNIYARMGERPQTRVKWLPALTAAACLLAAGVFVHHPAAQVAKPEAVDPQLFTDVYSMEQSMEPLAAKPIHELFDQDQ